MLLSLIRTSGRLLLFGGGLLIGIQVPAFVDQYSLRVDAHYSEVSANIAGFQRTADDLFGGDLYALVDYYRQSNDVVFERDADSLQIIVDRYYRISAEQQALQGNLLAVVRHVMFSADSELMQEARAEYSYTVPLNSLALQWGIALAVLMILLSELTYSCCAGCVRLVRGRKHRHHHQTLS